jgi:putative oxidoreductase
MCPRFHESSTSLKTNLMSISVSKIEDTAAPFLVTIGVFTRRNSRRQSVDIPTRVRRQLTQQRAAFEARLHPTRGSLCKIDRQPGEPNLPIFGTAYARASLAGNFIISYLLSTNADWVVAVVRITLGIVMFAHGAQKLLGWFGGAGFNATMDVFTVQMKLPSAIAALAIWTEFFGGLSLIVGLLSRVAAFGIAATMLAAILMVHLRNGFFMDWYGNKQGHGFEYHLLAIALALAVIVEGSGPLSLDAVYARHFLQPPPVSLMNY